MEHIGARTHPVHPTCQVWMNWPKDGLEPFDRFLRIVIVQLGDSEVEGSSSGNQLQMLVWAHDQIMIQNLHRHLP